MSKSSCAMHHRFPNYEAPLSVIIHKFSDEFCSSIKSRVDQRNATDVIDTHAQMGSSHNREQLIWNKIFFWHNVNSFPLSNMILHNLNPGPNKTSMGGKRKWIHFWKFIFIFGNCSISENVIVICLCASFMWPSAMQPFPNNKNASKNINFWWKGLLTSIGDNEFSSRRINVFLKEKA